MPRPIDGDKMLLGDIMTEVINSDVKAEAGPWIQWEVYYQPVDLNGKWVHYSGNHDENGARKVAAEVVLSSQVMGVKVERV